jgi:hypothetical protein
MQGKVATALAMEDSARPRVVHLNPRRTPTLLLELKTGLASGELAVSVICPCEVSFKRLRTK